MIGNRHVFVIGAQWIVRVTPTPAIARMMNAGKKIGEFADRSGQMHRALGSGMQQAPGHRLDFGALGGIGREQFGNPFAQCQSRRGRRAPSADSASDPPPLRQPFRPRPKTSRASSAAARSKIMSPIAMPPRGAPRSRTEDAKRQILYRKLTMTIGRGDPALAPRIMGFVDPAHRSRPFRQTRIARSSPFPPLMARRK